MKIKLIKLQQKQFVNKLLGLQDKHCNNSWDAVWTAPNVVEFRYWNIETFTRNLLVARYIDGVLDPSALEELNKEQGDCFMDLNGNIVEERPDYVNCCRSWRMLWRINNKKMKLWEEVTPAVEHKMDFDESSVPCSFDQFDNNIPF